VSVIVPAATNLSINPSFETGMHPWAEWGAMAGTAGTIGRVAAGAAWTGVAMYRWNYTSNPNASPTVPALIGQIGDGYWEHITGIEPGKQYWTSSMWRAFSPNLGYRIIIDWLNGAGTYLSSDGAPAASFDLPVDGQWHRRVWTAVAPANAARMAVYFQIFSLSGATGIIDFDGHMPSDQDTSYVDGDQGPDYSWVGTPHQSRSVRKARVWPVAWGSGGSYLVKTRFHRKTRDNVFMEDVSKYFVGGTVRASQDAEVMWQLETTCLDPDILPNYRGYIAPIQTVVQPDGTERREQVGLYQILPSGQSDTSIGVYGKIVAVDVLQQLKRKSHSYTYKLPAGTNVTNAVKAILDSSGLDRHIINNSSKVLSKPISWLPGTPLLTICNDLLQKIAFYHLYPDGNGRIRSKPYIKFKNAPSGGEYTSIKTGKSARPAVLGPFNSEPILTTLANHIVVVRDSPEKGVLKAVRKNNDDSTEFSINKIGLLSRPIYDSQLEDQEAVDATADRYMEEWGSIQINADFTTVAEPWHELHEVLDIALDRSDGAIIPEATGRFWSKGWELPLGATGRMKHDVYRIVDYTAEV
jgi:hypothetical protein